MAMLTLRPEFAMGTEVHLRTRPERLPGLVSGFVVRPGLIAYLVSWGDATESSHYDFELTDEPEL